MMPREKFAWAADHIQIGPGDHILEIGCGVGFFVDEIARRLDTGKIIAVDKSPAMVRAALKRNAPVIQSGRAEIYTDEFSRFAEHPHIFDKITASNVNFFWTQNTGEIALVREILKPGGYLYLFYDAPFDIRKKVIQPTVNAIQQYGFIHTDTTIQEIGVSTIIAITARKV